MKLSKIRPVKTPTRGTGKSAGIDFYIPDDYQQRTLVPNEDVLIPSGIKVKVPNEFALIAHDKSGQATKKNLMVGAKVIDEDYQGEVGIHIRNVGNSPVEIFPGEKIVQFILIPVSYDKVEVVDLIDLYDEVSERGEGGYGHTGIK